ncbi:hypothetical protein ASPBRDRAFT_232425 [Aspergillus brasiliensis CBS 101740]|uniref:Uncharacterized protein n=1 Tax=Aspergillus brasiliensis (strain CBS 101740 / IMI 381727 / IBT 21946) TaxID=767769 RepID=A0A1L9UZW6_ASPBC|nr:hypothetical protein ASPBRDRAFT_232425 [Aspergillus brasiliensis CBS 101740]
MCAVTMQTHHMARILLLINMPQESTAIWSTVTSRLHAYHKIESEVVKHAREICGISTIAGLPDAICSHTVQLLFVACQCFQTFTERQLVVNLLREVEDSIGWATEYRVRELMSRWAGCTSMTLFI